jgi:hypothetical protein
MEIGKEVSAAINQFPSISESPLHFQFSKLLIEPLTSLTFDPPLVVILDALDECGNVDHRRNLVTVLAEESSRLPSWLRLIIVSRTEYDIRAALVSKVHIRAWELSIASEANAADIQLYICDQTKVIRMSRTQLCFPEDWPGDTVINNLTEYAFGLFVWASTAVEYIRRAHYPARRLDSLLQDKPAAGAQAALNSLYQTALEEAGRWDDEEFVEDFRAIIGVVLAARNPLSASTIDLFLGIPSANTIALLGCLLTQHPTVRVLHPSFADFITNTDLCEARTWLIDMLSHNLCLAVACLERLHATLKRNICDLTLSSRQQKYSLSKDISYSCLYWIDHVCAVQCAKQVWVRVDSFLTVHLLHWFEAMSILKRSRDTVKLLLDLEQWIKVSGPILHR